MAKSLSHLDKRGNARMVDVGKKSATRRQAIAFGEIRVGAKLIALLEEGRVPKGDVFSVAKVAGIAAAKRTGELIPLCHPLPLDWIDVTFILEKSRVVARAHVKSTGKTGVEMEALTAVSVALLTIYDMCKSVDKTMEIGPVYLGKKSGGRSGEFVRKGVPSGWL